MSVTVRLLSSISNQAGVNEVLESSALNIRECIKDLNQRFTGLKGILSDSEGNVSNIFLFF